MKHHSPSIDTTGYLLRALDLSLSEYRYTRSPTSSLYELAVFPFLCFDFSLDVWFSVRNVCWRRRFSLSEMGSCSRVNWLRWFHNSLADRPELNRNARIKFCNSYDKTQLRIRVVSPTFPFAPESFRPLSLSPRVVSPPGRFAHCPVRPWVVSPTFPFAPESFRPLIKFYFYN